MDIWINGQFVPRDEARISVFDAGFQHGVGLFETLAARNGQVFRANQHMQRLADSARQLMLTERLRTRPLVEALQHCLDHNSVEDARLRLTLTGGDLNMLQATGESVVDPTIIIDTQPPTRTPMRSSTRV
jgi:branched-subunit amino acid aminotransferase/4-amino-4-deoxychorismate lyase